MQITVSLETQFLVHIFLICKYILKKSLLRIYGKEMWEEQLLQSQKSKMKQDVDSFIGCTNSPSCQLLHLPLRWTGLIDSSRGPPTTWAAVSRTHISTVVSSSGRNVVNWRQFLKKRKMWLVLIFFIIFLCFAWKKICPASNKQRGKGRKYYCCSS